MKLNVPDGYYSVTQAARTLGLSSNCMNFHIAQGNVAIVEVNKGYRNYYRLIREEALEAFIASEKAQYGSVITPI